MLPYNQTQQEVVTRQLGKVLWFQIRQEIVISLLEMEQ